ncbi:MurR/RpiR family transcriptional regulator [Thalassospira sp.]|uniref:MurR/RpiR family transcriptional regulator n=1 Tax=Thalassospira sp. TaxID=1912094 RepID=UPI002734E2B2|nr:MurR/RpiR family transcriptional regulator [Thalassospira sp.]MDP2696739.1 MurR/RpiR family transcriptional regulator [Thalassospira sp.]
MGVYADLRERLIAGYGDLSPQLQKAARYMLDHPDDVALKSMRSLARAADIQPSAIVRLMKTIGLESYQDFRLGYQNRLRDLPASYAGRAWQLQHRSAGEDHSEDALLGEIARQETDNLLRSFGPEARRAMRSACEYLEQARRVFVVGRRGAWPAAFQFAYACRLFRDDVTLLEGVAGTFGDELRGLGRKDVVLAVGFAPYTSETVKVTEFAAAQGAAIIAVTDSDVAPIAVQAAVTIVIADGSPSFFQSFTAAVSVLQALVALLVARGGEGALQQIASAEEQLAVFDTYWQDAGIKRNSRS